MILIRIKQRTRLTWIRRILIFIVRFIMSAAEHSDLQSRIVKKNMYALPTRVRYTHYLTQSLELLHPFKLCYSKTFTLKHTINFSIQFSTTY